MRPLYYSQEIVPISELFEEFRYFKMVPSPLGGTRMPVEPGFIFLSTLSCDVSAIKGNSVPYSWFLHVKPSQKLLDAGLGGMVALPIGSFEIIPWREQDKALVIARSSICGEAWLCFIPLADVPTQGFVDQIWEKRNENQARV